MEKLIKDVAKKIDGHLDFKKIVGGIAGTLLELFDGKIFEAALTFAKDKISEDYHDEFRMVLEAYLSGDYSKVKLESIARLNEAIDLPFLDEEEEEIILEGVAGSFFAIVKKRALTSKSVGGGGPAGDPDPGED